MQTTNGADALFARIRDIVNVGVGAAEESLGHVLPQVSVTEQYQFHSEMVPH